MRTTSLSFCTHTKNLMVGLMAAFHNIENAKLGGQMGDRRAGKSETVQLANNHGQGDCGHTPSFLCEESDYNGAAT